MLNQKRNWLSPLSSAEEPKSMKREIPEAKKIGVDYCTYTDLPKIPLSTPTRGSIGKTGEWRTFRPVLKGDCSSCGFCWAFCPEACIELKGESGKGKPVFDLEYCKGCGICAAECPKKCIEMQREGEDE